MGNKAERRVTVSVRLPRALNDRLSAAATSRVVGKSLLATVAIERYLDRLESEPVTAKRSWWRRLTGERS